MRSAFLSVFVATIGFVFSASGFSAHAAATRAPASAADLKPKAGAPACGPAQMPACDVLAKSSLNASKDPKLGFGAQRDGGVIYNVANFAERSSSNDPAVKDAVLKEQQRLGVTNATDEDAREKAKPIIAAAIEVIKNGNAELSPEQQSLVERLKTLTFKIAENDSHSNDAKNMIWRDDSLCQPIGYPNAAYKNETHTLLVCPATMNVAMKQFTQAIAHEIGHVISPCMERLAVYKVDPDQMFPGPVAECDRSLYYDEEGNRGPTSDIVATLMSEKPAYFVNYPNALSKTLASCGLTKEVPKSSTQTPKLFAKSMACLSKRYAANNKYAEDKYALGQIKKGASEKTSRAEFKREKPPYCVRVAEEHFADSFAAKVMDKLSTAQSWSKADYQIALLNMQGFVCTEPKNKTLLAADEYPLARERVRIQLNGPTAERVLSCSDAANDLCPLEVTPEDEKPTLSGAGSPGLSSTKNKTSTGSKK